MITVIPPDPPKPEHVTGECLPYTVGMNHAPERVQTHDMLTGTLVKCDHGVWWRLHAWGREQTHQYWRKVALRDRADWRRIREFNNRGVA